MALCICTCRWQAVWLRSKDVGKTILLVGPAGTTGSLDIRRPSVQQGERVIKHLETKPFLLARGCSSELAGFFLERSESDVRSSDRAAARSHGGARHRTPFKRRTTGSLFSALRRQLILRAGGWSWHGSETVAGSLSFTAMLLQHCEGSVLGTAILGIPLRAFRKRVVFKSGSGAKPPVLLSFIAMM